MVVLDLRIIIDGHAFVLCHIATLKKRAIAAKIIESNIVPRIGRSQQTQRRV